MEFTVRKFDLLQELTLIQGVVERKTTIPILANVLIRAEGGELGIAATDLEIGLKSICVSKTTVPGAVTLPAKRLYEIVRALPDNKARRVGHWTLPGEGDRGAARRESDGHQQGAIGDDVSGDATHDERSSALSLVRHLSLRSHQHAKSCICKVLHILREYTFPLPFLPN